jgi:hypothetical protein
MDGNPSSGVCWATEGNATVQAQSSRREIQDGTPGKSL